MACLNHPNTDIHKSQGIIRAHYNGNLKRNTATIKCQRIQNHISRDMFDMDNWYLVWHESFGDREIPYICQKCAELSYNKLIDERG